MSSSRAPWTTADIPDQTGRFAVITGGNSGLGLETAKALAAAGADVLIATRSAPKSESALAEIRTAAPRATVTREPLDLTSLASVAAFAEGRQRDGRPIDLLINNAGIMLVPKRTVTEDGFEQQLQTNFLGHYALTGRLLDLVRAASAPRVVSLGSVAARSGRINLNDLNAAGRYISWLVYSQSKLADVMLAVELDRRSRAGHWGITSVAAHPGFARTNLQLTGPLQGRDGGLSFSHLSGRIPGFSHTAHDGALPTLRAATAPDVQGGEYYGPTGRFELVGPADRVKIPRHARNQKVIDALWTKAEQMTGVAWPSGALAPA